MISICIPSYNRPNELLRLLESLKYEKGDFEILIAEDNSPLRSEIIRVVEHFRIENSHLNIKLLLNSVNLGYDGNLRNLIDNSSGEYCLFMGDDDLLKKGAIAKVLEVVHRNKNIGFILRSWEEINLEGETLSIQKYFSNDILFDSGITSIVSLFRKSVFISGLVIHKESANYYKTSDLDGKLLYQLYLLANILLDKKGYYISDILAVRISGAEHYFGSAKSEKNNFSPKSLSINHSLNFMQGFIDIIEYIDRTRNTSLKNQIVKDLSKYSYGFLSIQREKGLKAFYVYTKELSKKGFGNTVYFYFYILLLSVLGLKLSNALILFFKKNLKSIPRL